jgi:CotH kinase protein/Secretion system C-terminal sorting domain/Fn3 associated
MQIKRFFTILVPNYPNLYLNFVKNSGNSGLNECVEALLKIIIRQFSILKTQRFRYFKSLVKPLPLCFKRFYSDYSYLLMNKIVSIFCFLGLTLSANAQELRVTTSVPRGIIQGQTTITLTPPPGATIRYTTNQTMPSRTNGTIYTKPIVVNATTVIKTFAYTATKQSLVESFSYISLNKGGELTFPNLVTAGDYANGLKQLPIISISVPPGGRPAYDKTEQMCTFEYINKFGEGGNIGILSGVEGYGNDSYIDSDQKNLRVSFKKVYGFSNLAFPIFKRDDVDTRNPVTKYDVLDLKIGQDGPNADGYGMLMSSQGLVSKTMREMGNVDLHAQYVHTFVNGKYNGIYTLKEPYDGHFASDYYGGKSADYDEIEGDWESPEVKGTSTLNTWNALQSATQQNRYGDVKRYLNVAEFIDFMIVMMYFDNEWEYRAFAHKQLTTTKLVFENHDTDGALTKISDENEYAYDRKWSNPSRTVFNGPSGLFGNLVRSNNPEFKALLRDRVYNAFQRPNAPLSPQRIQRKLEEMRSVLRPAFNMELARFNKTFYNNNPYFDQEYNQNVAHLYTRYNYNLNKWLGVLAGRFAPEKSELVEDKSFTVAPNPASDFADIDLTAAKNQFVTLAVYNTLGEAVLKQNVENAAGTYRLALDGLAAGQYILAIQMEDQSTIGRKLSVKR